MDLNALAEEVVALLRPRSEKKSIEYHLIVEPGLSQVLGDRDQMYRALVNLVENALNYTPPRGQVRVSTRAHSGHVLVEVSDSGIGIQPDQLTRIFERFYRTPEARAVVSSGTGLGLAIIKKIVDIHHGTIEVHSEPGKGSSFRIQLPEYRPGDSKS